MKNFKIGALIMAGILILSGSSASAKSFDPAYYASKYPDVVNALGTDSGALYNHYMTYGINEGRFPYEGASSGEAVDGIADTKAAVQDSGLVPLKELANKGAVRKNMTDEEFQQAYNAAVSIVTPLIGKSREEQLSGICSSLRAMVDSGRVAYSTSEAHYNDPYGYLVKGVASCAGCARTVGLCLNMLGIPFEHVNANQWCHQWARVPMNDGSFYICDPYGLYCGAEPAPYMHPRVAY